MDGCITNTSANISVWTKSEQKWESSTKIACGSLQLGQCPNVILKFNYLLSSPVSPLCRLHGNSGVIVLDWLPSKIVLLGFLHQRHHPLWNFSNSSQIPRSLCLILSFLSSLLAMCLTSRADPLSSGLFFLQPVKYTQRDKTQPHTACQGIKQWLFQNYFSVWSFWTKRL